MPLAPGSRLGPYEITAPLGAGGMGEVYRARDTRLGRSVAIKVLPQHTPASSDDRARFRREAKTISSLNHPHICVLHDIGQEGDTDFLVMELVEGETLARRLTRGPLPVAEVLKLGAQIADALDRAHRAGVIHRDLKPGNVMLTKSGAKLMDFGLARMSGHAARAPVGDLTATAPAGSAKSDEPITAEGMVVGTFQYMAPEQLEGKEADARSDIWALGCVLYEMATGKRAFEGSTAVSVISAIMRDQPRAMTELAPLTPAALDRAVRQCLSKDPEERWQTAGDLRRELAWVTEMVASGPPDVSRAGRQLLNWRWIATALIVGIIAVWSVETIRATHTFRRVQRLSIAIPPDIRLLEAAISPLGDAVTVIGRPQLEKGEPPARERLYRRSLDAFRFDELEGTEGAQAFKYSVDGRWLYFTAPISPSSTDLRLFKTLASGGTAPIPIADWDSSWVQEWAPLADGEILATTSSRTAYVRISSTGGSPSAPVTLSASGYRGFFGIWQSLPDDRGVLVNTYASGLAGTGILDPKTGRVKIILPQGESATYSPTGHLLFVRNNTLCAAPFDLRRLELTGGAISILSGLRSSADRGSPFFSVSQAGALVYASGGAMGGRRRLVVVDAAGHMSEWNHDEATYDWGPVADTEGKRIACRIRSPKGTDEIWIAEKGGGSARRAIAVPSGNCGAPIWSPDGGEIAYNRDGTDSTAGVYIQTIEGGQARHLVGPGPIGSVLMPSSWSPDGSEILATRFYGDQYSVFRVSVAGQGTASPTEVVSGAALAKYSPDGKWIAYESGQSGEMQIYIAPYQPGGSLGNPVMVSGGPGVFPRWSRSGTQLFFMYPGPYPRIMSVSVRFRPALSVGAPIARWDLSQLRLATFPFEILPDDRLLAYERGAEEQEIAQLDVVLNFVDELKRNAREDSAR